MDMETVYQVDQRGVLLHEKPHLPGQPLPALCVRVAPPEAPEGQVARWNATVPDSLPGFGEENAGSWGLDPDFRKTPVYLTADGATYAIGAEVDEQMYEGTGPLPAWLTSLERPSKFHNWQGGAWVLDAAAELDDAKESKQRELDAARDAALVAGFEFDGHVYDSDEKSIQRINAIATLTLLDPGFSTNYITKDNQIVTLDSAQIAGLGQAAATHEAAMVFQARALKDQVLAATTPAQVEAVEWFLPA